MFETGRITNVYNRSEILFFDKNEKFVIMSDCHRGDGSYADNFARNQNLFFAALTQYYHHDYTYIELGDGDELWENDKIAKIMEVYDNIFWLLSQFHRRGRLYMLFGNHDIAKAKGIDFFPGIKFYESLILKHKTLDFQLFLLHGHQADFFNDRLWPLSRFLVRYFWRPLELLGVNNPMSAATNPTRKKVVEKILIHWVEKFGQPLVAGHTHRAVFPGYGEPHYFNDGSCVHPRCITALEIASNNINLVKWSYKTKFDGTLYVGRDILAGPENLALYS